MLPEPLFAAFDAGWVLLGVAALAVIVWLIVDIRRTGIPIHDDDDDWGVEPRRPDLEDDARRNPF